MGIKSMKEKKELNDYYYAINPGPLKREVIFHNWSEDPKHSHIGAVTIIDHTGYKMFFTAGEIKKIIKMIEERNDAARNK